MQNWPKAEKEKRLVEKQKMALSPIWRKMAKKWRKKRKMNPNPFLPSLRHFFAISVCGPFVFFSTTPFPILGFRPVLHSMPGRLTSNCLSLHPLHYPSFVFVQTRKTREGCGGLFQKAPHISRLALSEGMDGGVWNGHFFESVNYFPEAAISRKLPENSAERTIFAKFQAPTCENSEPQEMQYHTPASPYPRFEGTLPKGSGTQ